MTSLPAIAGVLALFLAAPAAQAMEVERVVSPGGIEAWLVEDHSNPLIALEVVFEGAGGVADPDGKLGLSEFAASVIDEGAGDLDSQAFQGELEDYNIKLSFGAGQDNFSGSLETLTENRERAFELLRLALSEPRFDEEPVERIRGQLAIGAARAARNPSDIANRNLQELIFEDHPYSRPNGGTAKTLQAIAAADMRALIETRLARDNMVIGVAGDITPEELGRLLDSTFAALPAESQLPEIPEIEVAGEGDVVVAEMPIPQSVVRIAQAGIARDDPDYYAAQLVNEVLGGGGFFSRLYAEVREKRGLAYSVWSYLRSGDYGNATYAGVATENSRVGESLEVIREQWRRMAEGGPSAEELELAKQHMTGSFPLRLSSSGAVAGMLAAIQLEKLGIDYLDERAGYIEAVTLEDARRVARELLDADSLDVVIVGAPGEIETTRPPLDPGS
ncbi:MAG: pitrilysin family protein [Rhodovibrionaceae bacterium]